MLKFIYRISISLFISFMILVGANAVFAQSNRSNNGKFAQVQVHFKIIIAPSLSIDAAIPSTGGLIAGPNYSGDSPAMMRTEKTAPFLLGNPALGEFTFAELPEIENLSSGQKGMRQLILCSP